MCVCSATIGFSHGNALNSRSCFHLSSSRNIFAVYGCGQSQTNAAVPFLLLLLPKVRIFKISCNTSPKCNAQTEDLCLSGRKYFYCRAGTSRFLFYLFPPRLIDTILLPIRVCTAYIVRIREKIPKTRLTRARSWKSGLFRNLCKLFALPPRGKRERERGKKSMVLIQP